ncbi:hypothetical protein LEP1GSC016_3197 [Leptospira borgpetersenii serovar Hardjo-bovis str. Sponselee]|uniref:Uncharacterized protein n=1 Tax=Leptospira borgpetersenii serovar Hardjo-bovis str. Sponselee TaxID=1303729 RepID=M6C1R6_LEPBO|nr:hypothetical protein LEP1GSC016_3197 [Leptospira borgpetersenii serovar Hardjo-bovis str. Sponselee]
MSKSKKYYFIVFECVFSKKEYFFDKETISETKVSFLNSGS